MKKIKDILFWLLFVVAALFFAYQKGYILAPFPSISPKEAYNLIQNDKNLTILDVRENSEYKSGHIKGALLIPVGSLSVNLSKLPKDKKILVYCRSGHRSLNASRVLEKNGFHPINLKGGIEEWRREKLPLD